MDGFAAEFRGFWVARGYGAAIQRTADSAGAVWAKKFLKKGRKTENWGARGAGRWIGGTLYRMCEVILGLEARPLATLLEPG